MKVKTSELKDKALDWAVARLESKATPPGMSPAEVLLYRSVATQAFSYPRRRIYYSTDWSQGGPIIERESIFLTPGSENMWPSARTRTTDGRDTGWVNGETMLIAAMRCYVASKLGDEVEVPDELFA